MTRDARQACLLFKHQDPRTGTLQFSNIADRGYLGPEITLATFGPLIKREAENRNATIVALFLNAVHEVHAHLDHQGPTRANLERIRSYIPLTRDIAKNSSKSSAAFIRFMIAEVYFRDYDEFFNLFKRECRLDEISKAARLTMKSENTIVRPWPMRIRKDATQSEFGNLFASGHTGSERYVEWKSAA